MQLVCVGSIIIGTETMGARRSNPYSHVKRGKSEEFGGVFFRSGAEVTLAKYFKLRGWRWEYEPEEFLFPMPRGTVCFTPDFRVWLDDTHYKWVEMKGWFDSKTKTKLRRFAKFYPEHCKRLVLVTDWKECEAWVEENFPEDVAKEVEVWPFREIERVVRWFEQHGWSSEAESGTAEKERGRG